MKMLPPVATRFALAASLTAAAAGIGCAQILGAQFDEATQGEPDSSADGASHPLDASIDAQPFDPRSVDHLELWLAADYGISVSGLDAGDAIDGQSSPLDGVALWEDRSGKGHTAVGVDPQRRPVVVRDAGPSPVVSFNRAQQTCLTDTWVSPIGVPSALTFFVVSQGDATNVLRFGTLGAIAFPWDSNYSHLDGNEPQLRLLVAPSAGAREMPLLGSDARVWELLSARLVARDVGGLRSYRNGQLSEQASLTNADLPSLDALTIGCVGLVDEFATALVGEVLVYTAALSDADRLRVEDYLRTKWRLY